MTSERALEQGVWTGHIDEDEDLDVALAEDRGQTKVRATLSWRMSVRSSRKWMWVKGGRRQGRAHQGESQGKSQMSAGASWPDGDESTAARTSERIWGRNQVIVNKRRLEGFSSFTICSRWICTYELSIFICMVDHCWSSRSSRSQSHTAVARYDKSSLSAYVVINYEVE